MFHRMALMSITPSKSAQYSKKMDLWSEFAIWETNQVMVALTQH